MHLCANVSHHVTNRCIFTYQTATKRWLRFDDHFQTLSLFFFFPLFQVLQQLRRRLSDWWGKGLLMFSLSAITRTMKAQSSVLLLPFSFLCLSLSVCLSSPPAGWDLDHHGVWENDGRAERDLCHPGEVYVFHLPSFHTEIYHCVCPHTPLTIFRKASFGTFWVTLKINNSGKRFELQKARPPGFAIAARVFSQTH